MPEEIIKNDNGQIVIPRENLKSLFHLMVGRPDSQHKVFNKDYKIDLSSLIDLNNRVQEKLRHHHCQINVSVDVFFERGKVQQFSTWEDFANRNWNNSEKTEAAVLKWDFLVAMPEFQVPQRHTLVLKITSNISMQDIMPLLFGRNSDEVDTFELKTATLICRVDFISHLLGEELIELVTKWTKALPKRNELYYFYKIEPWVKPLSQYSFAFFFLFVYALIFYKTHIGLENHFALKPVYLSAYFVLVGAFIIKAANTIADSFFSKITRKLFKSIKVPNLCLTRGDQLFIEESEKKILRKVFLAAPKYLLGVILNIGLALLIN